MREIGLFGEVPPPKPRHKGTGCRRPGWTRVEAVARHKQCGGVWRHDASGWLVLHCGHPTALWPYYGMRPEGGPMLLSRGWGKGIAFQTLERAQEAVEREFINERIEHERGKRGRRPTG